MLFTNNRTVLRSTANPELVSQSYFALALAVSQRGAVHQSLSFVHEKRIAGKDVHDS